MVKHPTTMSPTATSSSIYREAQVGEGRAQHGGHPSHRLGASVGPGRGKPRHNVCDPITLLPAALDSRLQRDAGMNLFEYRVMKTLAEQPDGSMRLKSLAALANGSLSRLSHVITRLERRGWVRRYSERTGRATHARLTDEGVTRSWRLRRATSRKSAA